MYTTKKIDITFKSCQTILSHNSLSLISCIMSSISIFSTVEVLGCFLFLPLGLQNLFVEIFYSVFIHFFKTFVNKAYFCVNLSRFSEEIFFFNAVYIYIYSEKNYRIVHIY